MGTWWFLRISCVWILIFLDCPYYSFSFAVILFDYLAICFYYFGKCRWFYSKLSFTCQISYHRNAFNTLYLFTRPVNKPSSRNKNIRRDSSNVLLCNLKFFQKTFCSLSLLRWQLSVVWKLFPCQCSFGFEGNEWINVFDRAIPCCNVSVSADIRFQSSPISYTKHLYHFKLYALYIRSLRKWTF